MFNEIKKNPSAGSFMYDSVRYRVLKKFPFIIFYEIVNDITIAVYRIFHTSQNPYWQ